MTKIHSIFCLVALFAFFGAWPAMGENSATVEDEPSALYVQQKEYALVGLEQFRWMQTSGIGPCIALVLYHPTFKLGYIAHFDALTYVAQSFNQIELLFERSGLKWEQLNTYLIGGMNLMSESLVRELEEALTGYPVHWVQRDLLGTSWRSIQLDLLTGKVSDYEETTSPELLPGYQIVIERMSLGRMPLFASPYSKGTL